MAVLFPTPFGATLSPKNPAQLLQAFVNIENVEGVNTGELTRANLLDYLDKRFLGVDPSHQVASYLLQKFDSIATRDGNGASVSVSDLVQLRRGLPNPDRVPIPPQAPPPVTPGNNFLLGNAPLGGLALSNAAFGNVPLGSSALSNAVFGNVPLGSSALSNAAFGNVPLGGPGVSNAAVPGNVPLGGPALSNAAPGNASLGSSLGLLVLSLLSLLSNLFASLSGSTSQ